MSTPGEGDEAGKKVPEAEDAIHVFADAAMALAQHAKALTSSLEQSNQDNRAQFKEVLRQQRAFDEDRKAAAKRSLVQILVALGGGLVLILVVVVSAALVLANQNHTASEQRGSLTNVLTLLVDCTTPTPEPTRADPKPRVHECYQRGNQQQAVAIRQLQLGTLYANECARMNLIDGALLSCVNSRLAAAGIPPIQS